MKIIKRNKGFILAEAVITSVFVLGIFTFVLANVFPLIGKYERTLNYDNLEDLYLCNNVREIISASGVTLVNASNRTVKNFCGASNTFCIEALSQLNVDRVVVPKIESTGTRAHVKIGEPPISSGTRALKAYVKYFNNNNTCEKDAKVVIIRFLNSDSEGKVTYSSFCM